MTRGFANYQLNDSASNAAYQIRGNGSDLDQHANKIVQIQGVADPKDNQNGKTVFYATKVTDQGQSCGNTQPQQQVAAASGGQVAQSGTVQSNSGMTSGTPTASAGAIGAPSNPEAMNNQGANGQQSSAQGGVAGAASSTHQSGGVEDKGTPQAGPPQASSQTGNIGPNPSATSGNSGQSLQGCLSGSANSLTLQTNGGAYSLQGNTTSALPLVGHQVEVTGELSGSSVKASNVRDLGNTCSAK